MYIYVYIYIYIHIHICFHNSVIVNNAAIYMGCIHLIEINCFSFLCGRYIYTLNCNRWIIWQIKFHFFGTFILFSIMIEPIYIPSDNVQGSFSPFLAPVTLVFLLIAIPGFSFGYTILAQRKFFLFAMYERKNKNVIPHLAFVLLHSLLQYICENTSKKHLPFSTFSVMPQLFILGSDVLMLFSIQ